MRPLSDAQDGAHGIMMRVEDGVAGADKGATPFFCFRFAIGNEWSVGFSGKRGSARFTGSKHRFSPVFPYFSRFAPRYTATEVVRRPDEDKTVIRSRTRLLHNIGLTLALVCPPTRKTAQSLNQGGRVLNIASYNSFVVCFCRFLCARIKYARSKRLLITLFHMKQQCVANKIERK